MLELLIVVNVIYNTYKLNMFIITSYGMTNLVPTEWSYKPGHDIISLSDTHSNSSFKEQGEKHTLHSMMLYFDQRMLKTYL